MPHKWRARRIDVDIKSIPRFGVGVVIFAVDTDSHGRDFAAYEDSIAALEDKV
jgi:hypothetical protein